MRSLAIWSLILIGSLATASAAAACSFKPCAVNIDQVAANYIDLTQGGDNNLATIGQSGSASNSFTGSQAGARNQLTAYQASTGLPDSAEIEQVGSANAAYVYQNAVAPTTPGAAPVAYTPGGGDSAHIYQGGLLTAAASRNTASIEQNGSNDSATISQYGSFDKATSIQTGSNNSQTIAQFGNHDMATYVQTGNGSSNYIPFGIAQTGNNMSVTVTQSQTPYSVVVSH